jgi:heterodisulfide reductase subunit A-like polyferredoxin
VTEDLCNGCGRCVEACEPRVLEVDDEVAVLMRPNRCCSGGECVAACQEGAMRMDWVEMEGDRTQGRWVSGGRVWPARVRGGPAWNPRKL